MRRGIVLCVVAAVVDFAPLSAQTIQGRALEEFTDAPVASVLVRLVDGEGVAVAVAATDSSGLYRVSAPAPGIYRLVAERIGYESIRTPRLEMRDSTRTFTVDLLLRRAPVPLPGLIVQVPPAEAERRIQRILGLRPASLRIRPIHRAEILASLEKGHDLAALLRWQNLAGLAVFRTRDGPCFTLRGSGCLPVYFNGTRYRQKIVDAIPLDMIHTIVVLSPREHVAYMGGAVLLFSEAWLK